MVRALVLACAVGITALAVYSLALAPELTPRATAHPELAFQPTDDPTRQLAATYRRSVESVSVSAAFARAWALLPGSPNLNVLSAILAAIAAAALCLVVTRLGGLLAGFTSGVGWLASPLIVSNAIASGGTLSATTVVASALAAWAALVEWRRSEHRAWLAIVVIACAAAATEDLAMGAAAALIAGAARRERRAGGSILIACLVLGAGAAAHLADFYWLRSAAGMGLPAVLDATWTGWFRWDLASHLSSLASVTERLPVVARVMTEQIGLLGWLVAALGVPWRISGLLAIGGALLVSAAPFPGPWDPQVDTLLPLAIVWASIGFGVGRVNAWGPKATPVACTLAVLLPLLQAGRSIAADKVMVDRTAGNMLAAFTSQQAGPGGIVLEDAPSGRLLLWANRRRHTEARWELVPQDRSILAERAARDTPLFAFEGSAARVALLGLTGPPAEVKGRTLASLFESVDRAAVVGLVVSPGAMPTSPDDREALGDLVSERAVLAEGRAVALFARRSIGLAHVVHGDSAIELAAGPSIRSDIDPALVPPADTRLNADAAGARVELGGREIATLDRGALVAWWSPPDQRFDWLPFHAGSSFTAPWRHERWSVSRIRTTAPCVPVGDAWSDAAESTRAGRLGVALGTGVQLRIYLAHERPLFIRGAGFAGRSSPNLTVVSWDRANADQSHAAATAMATDGVPENAPGQAGRRYVWQVTLDAATPAPGVLAIGLGGAPAWALVRRSAGRPDALASVCGGVAGERLFTSGDVREESLSLAAADSFAAGWLPLERTATGRSRTLGESGGEMLVRLDVPQEVEVVVTARTDQSISAAGTLTLYVNDVAEGERAAGTQTTSYRWGVPAQRWLPGTNRLLLRSGGTGGSSLPLVVTEVRFRR